MKKYDKKGKRRILKNYFFIFLFLILIVALVSAYPILDSGITGNLEEDQLPVYTYNFTQNVTGYSTTDIFSIYSINSTLHQNFTSPNNFTWISINSTTGIMSINATSDNETGNFSISIQVVDINNEGTTVASEFIVNATNDAPQFSNLENKSFSISELFSYIINITDEENDIPFSYNITFLSCNTAQWSDRGSTNCELFNSSQYSTDENGSINISFTPVRNDVGTYEINFTVTDSGNTTLPYNATRSSVVNFTVLNVNSVPYFTYYCENDNSTTEDQDFNCYVNVTDIDETNNLTLSSNESWFTFNNSLANQTLNVNSSTGFNASFNVSFVPTDIAVGNWVINLSVTDTSSGVNSTLLHFFVDNINDSVSIGLLANKTVYTSENYTVYLNASDDDLLVTDKSVFNESLTFSSNYSSWINISSTTYISGTNISQATIDIYPSNAPNGSGKNYTVNISVRDVNNFSISSLLFEVQVIGNSPPEWNSSTSTTLELTEDSNFYLNLTQNVTDPENDILNFSYSIDNSFPSFSLNATTGVVNFTPIDADVGDHSIEINVSDGVSVASLDFLFTVNNINDSVYIEQPILQGNVINASVDSNSNINASEDNVTIIYLWVQDDDFKIPSSQKSFYNESLSVNVTIDGPNTTLISFEKNNAFPIDGSNRSQFVATFTPKKADVGTYNITINVSDLSNNYDVLEFNLTVSAVSHNPVLMTLTDMNSSVNRTLFLDINATDAENGNDSSGNFVFGYTFLNGTDFINNNESIFNTTSGVLNITFNDTSGGSYRINISVNDTNNNQDFGSFWIYVYDNPALHYPAQNTVFDLTENTTSVLNFTVNHSVGDNLNYTIYINSTLRDSQIASGDNSNFSWSFTPNFTDETYGSYENLTLVVSSLAYSDVNSTFEFLVNISHANAPLEFSGTIPSKETNYNQNLEINLLDYFSDIDNADKNLNQSLNFTVYSNATSSSISYNVDASNNYALTFSASSVVQETFTVNGSDLDSSNNSLTNVSSNSFVISFTTPTVQTTPTSSSGGGGSSTKVTSMKFILDSPIVVKFGENVKIPVNLLNDGKVSFRSIKIRHNITFNSIENNLIDISLVNSDVSSLNPGGKFNTTLNAYIGAVTPGTYEVDLVAESTSPSYSTDGKIYLIIKKDNLFEDRLLFTSELISDNPECLEIQELIPLSRKYLDDGNFKLADKTLSSAIAGCKEAISQRGVFMGPKKKKNIEDTTFLFLIGFIIISVLLGAVYYIYKEFALRKAIGHLRKI